MKYVALLVLLLFCGTAEAATHQHEFFGPVSSFKSFTLEPAEPKKNHTTARYLDVSVPGIMQIIDRKTLETIGKPGSDDEFGTGKTMLFFDKPVKMANGMAYGIQGTILVHCKSKKATYVDGILVDPKFKILPKGDKILSKLIFTPTPIVFEALCKGKKS